MACSIQSITSRVSLRSSPGARSGTILWTAHGCCSFVLVAVGLLTALVPAYALEKYGRPLPSMEEESSKEAREAEETLFGGYFLSSAFISNPTFAARPDNTGLVGLRHMAHLETDLYKQWRTAFPNQNVNAYTGFGWLFHNSNYFARPDNTGHALFRYVAHVDADLYKNTVVFFGDFNLFTDRELDNKVKPTELDWIVGLAFRFKDDYEVSIYREQDRALDKPGSLVQEYWAVQFRMAFDVPKRMFSRVR